VKDKEGQDPLHIAATAGNIAIVESLVEHGLRLALWHQKSPTRCTSPSSKKCGARAAATRPRTCPRRSTSKKVGPRLTRDFRRDILLLRELIDYEDEVEHTYISLTERDACKM
jgi:hypothetical protein